MEEASSLPTKRKVGRPKKLITESPREQTTEVPRKRGRPRKVITTPPSDETPPCVSEVELSQDIPASTPQMKPKKRRHQNEPDKAKWGRIVGNVPRDIIPGQRLPTKRVVMQRYHTINPFCSSSTTIPAYAKQLYDEILPIWKKAGIPTKCRKTCVQRLNDLLSSWVAKRCRDMKSGSEEEVSYISMLDSLFMMCDYDFKKVEEELKEDRLKHKQQPQESDGLKTWEVDILFLKNQMLNPQFGTIGSKDKDYEKRKETQSLRLEEKRKREEKEKEKAKERYRAATCEELEEIGEDSVQDEDDQKPSCSKDEDYVPRKYLRKPKKLEKVMLELPTKDLAKNTADLCDRLKLSHRSVTSLFAKVILSGGGELKDFVLSKSTAWRQRILGEKEVEKKLKLKAEALYGKNPYGVLHIDGKKVKFESGAVEERLVICLQQVDSGEIPRFLGAPQTPNGKGAAQCEAMIRYIDDNGIEDQLIGHCWDTTASNTGCHSGAAILLDRALGRASLWIACRRHAAERHIVHANETVCGESKSPEEQLFAHFKKNFNQLDTSVVHQFQWPTDDASPSSLFITERASSVKTWAEACSVTGSFPREDYRELLELVIHSLNGKITRRSAKTGKLREVPFHMEDPGAFHHARFMSKAIYYLKMFMLSPQLLQLDLITNVESNAIERMSTFVILLYGQYFLQTALTTAAPRLDLGFWRNAKRYSCVDLAISDEVVKSVHRQMFYLTEEMVMLALCDKDTDNSEKKDLVQALLRQDRPQQFAPQKPKFKVELLLNKNHDEPKLTDFVGPRSWLIFDIFDVDVLWMQYPPSDWDQQPEYQRLHRLLNGLICVNDVAERNVQNVCEYAEFSKDPERRDRVVKVVNSHRELVDFSDLTKAELSKL